MGWRSLVACALLFACVWLLYARTAGFEYINFDDPVYVSDNVQVQAGLTLEGLSWAFSTSTGGYPSPMTWISHMADTELFGLGPAGPHLMNVMIHSLNLLLLMYFLFGATGAFWRSFLVVAIFALHPLRVESVAWVAERKDVLSGFFMLATLCFYLKYTRTRKFGFYLCTFLAYLLAVLSKPVAVTMPVVLWLIDIWPLKRIEFVSAPGESRGQTLRRWCREYGVLGLEKVPFLILSAVWSGLTVLALSGREVFVSSTGLPLLDRLAGVAPNYATYLKLIFWPRGLALLYPHPLGWTAFEILGSLLILVSISGLAIVCALRRWYVLAVGWGWFLVVTFPVCGILQNGSQSVADRFVYFSGIGVTIAVVWGVWRLIEGNPHARRIGAVMGIAVVVTMGYLTHSLVGFWKDSVTVFSRAAAVTKNSVITYTNLSFGYLKKEEYQKAIAAGERAAELGPGMTQPLNSVGIAYASLGEIDKAMSFFRRALELQPYLQAVNNNLADLLLQKGEWNEAATHYFRSLHDVPGNARAYTNLGEIFAKKERSELAEKYTKLALEVAPPSAPAFAAYWRVLSVRYEWEKAFAQYKSAIRSPADLYRAHSAAGAVCFEERNYAGARVHFTEALQAGEGDATVRFDLAEADIRLGLIDEALAEIARATERDSAVSAGRLLKFSLLLSTHQDPVIRARKDSEALVMRAMESFSEESAFAWLVVAYAKAGRSEFQAAVEACAKADAIARTSGRAELRSRIAKIAKEYSEGRIVPMEVIAPDL